MISTELIQRYAHPVPRYTSYPTAPHFHEGITESDYRDWLDSVPPFAPVSLYLHVPFCDRLCWFCGCHTKQVLRYDPIAAYLKALRTEIETVSALLQRRGRVMSIHLGGGSPSMLHPNDLAGLLGQLRQSFTMAQGCEVSIEIDPNDMSGDRYEGMAEAGITRASIGVQDFDPRVQATINRIQSFEQTREVVDDLRHRGIRSVNLDVLYGLPHQTLETLTATIVSVLAIRPDRIALFGYAHVPWAKPHQRLIDESALPGPLERFRQAEAAARMLVRAGYRRIGMDHFALPQDSLAAALDKGRLHRNFQGYTTDGARVLLGLGASSIGTLPQGYMQNTVATGQYIRHVEATGLAVAKGYALTDDDRARSYLIERLMCVFEVDGRDLEMRFGEIGEGLVRELRIYAAIDTDALSSWDGQRFSITERGRPFVRSIASGFDAYFGKGTARHSIAI